MDTETGRLLFGDDAPDHREEVLPFQEKATSPIAVPSTHSAAGNPDLKQVRCCPSIDVFLQNNFQKALQIRAFAKFLRYREIEILTYVKYAPVSISLWP